MVIFSRAIQTRTALQRPFAGGRALGRRGHSVTIYGCGDSEEPSAGACANVQVLKFPRRGRHPFEVPELLLKRLERNEDRLDLILIHGMFIPPNLAVAKAALRGRIRYIACPHDPYHPDLLSKNAIRKWVYGAAFERSYLHKATAVQLLCEDHEQYIERYAGARRVLVVPNGFDSSEGAIPNDAGPLGVLTGDPAILLLGRVDAHHKGHDLIIESLAAARRDQLFKQSLVVNIVGSDGGDRSALEQLAERLQVRDQVRFLGRVSDVDRQAALRSCDALILPSRYDGFGLVALEAMLSGKTVLVSSQAGIAPWVTKAEADLCSTPT